MTRRPYRHPLACRSTHRSRALACWWTVFSVTVGVGVHPHSVVAQADPRPLRVSPFVSTGPSQPLINWSQNQGNASSRAWKGALVGAGIGAGVGFIALEMFKYCDPADNSPTYTCTIHRGRVALLGAGTGAVLGALIGQFTGSRGSSQAWRPVPRLVPSSDGGWTLSMSVPSGFRSARDTEAQPDKRLLQSR